MQTPAIVTLGLTLLLGACGGAGSGGGGDGSAADPSRRAPSGASHLPTTELLAAAEFGFRTDSELRLYPLGLPVQPATLRVYRRAQSYDPGRGITIPDGSSLLATYPWGAVGGAELHLTVGSDVEYLVLEWVPVGRRERERSALLNLDGGSHYNVYFQ